jgi:hypothetical protein
MTVMESCKSINPGQSRIQANCYRKEINGKTSPAEKVDLLAGSSKNPSTPFRFTKSPDPPPGTG